MEVLKFDEVKKTWRQIAKHNINDLPPDFELEVYKKLLEVFHVGDFYYFIFNLSNVEVEMVSDSVRTVLGISPTEFTPKFVFESIHPDDQQRFTLYEKKVTDFFNQLPPEKILKYKVSYDYRMKTTDGGYKWIHQQIITLQSNPEGAVIRTLGIHTDISHLKSGNVPAGLSIAGLEGEPSYYNIVHNQIPALPFKEIFTKREKEVIRLIGNGANSIEIAETLFISKHTVTTHRKNILKKADCKNWMEFFSIYPINS